MQRLAFLFFAVAVVVSTGFIVATGQDLPPRVASHFGLHGAANGYMPRALYLLAFALLAGALPIALSAVTALVVRKAPRFAHRRDRQCLLQPENRPIAIPFLTARSLVTSGLVSMLLGTLHYLVLQANQVVPPHLPYPAFPLVMGTFVVAFLSVGVLFKRQMRAALSAHRRIDG